MTSELDDSGWERWSGGSEEFENTNKETNNTSSIFVVEQHETMFQICPKSPIKCSFKLPDKEILGV